MSRKRRTVRGLCYGLFLLTAVLYLPSFFLLSLNLIEWVG